MDLTLRYRHYLEEQKLSPLSIKNYLADLNKFLAWRETIYEQRDWTTDFKAYYQFLQDQPTPSSSLQRYLSSLRQFGQFLVNGGETAENPAAALTPMSQNLSQTNLGEVDKLLDGFEKSMMKEKLSASTIRNYVVDVRQFLIWFRSK